MTSVPSVCHRFPLTGADAILCTAPQGHLEKGIRPACSAESRYFRGAQIEKTFLQNAQPCIDVELEYPAVFQALQEIEPMENLKKIRAREAQREVTRKTEIVNVEDLGWL